MKPSRVLSIEGYQFVISIPLLNTDVTTLDWYSRPIGSSRPTVGKRIYVVQKNKKILMFVAEDQGPRSEEEDEEESSDDSQSGGADNEK